MDGYLIKVVGLWVFTVKFRFSGCLKFFLKKKKCMQEGSNFH